MIEGILCTIDLREFCFEKKSDYNHSNNAACGAGIADRDRAFKVRRTIRKTVCPVRLIGGYCDREVRILPARDQREIVDQCRVGGLSTRQIKKDRCTVFHRNFRAIGNLQSADRSAAPNMQTPVFVDGGVVCCAAAVYIQIQKLL